MHRQHILRMHKAPLLTTIASAEMAFLVWEAFGHAQSDRPPQQCPKVPRAQTRSKPAVFQCRIINQVPGIQHRRLCGCNFWASSRWNTQLMHEG